MKNAAYFNKFVRIIAGGVTGAFLLCGISVILVIVVGEIIPIAPWIGYIFFVPLWTLERVYSVFIIAGIAGFILGLIKRNSPIIQKCSAPALILGIPLIFGLWIFYGVASHVETPRQIKLTDITNSIVTVHFKVPKGRNYHLELSIPSGSTNAFSGSVSILNGASTITNFPIGSAQADVQCNFFHAQTNYNMEIRFNQQPPPSTSLWLDWLQAYKDRDK
ncbi:MAG: hypothetical protein ACREFE_14605 [Limisphaerales bacterium]